MEVFADSRAEGESPRGTVDFKKFIRQVEANCEKTLLHRKNKLLFRQKLKENWLTRTKIIPPSFPQLPSRAPSDPPSPSARPPCKTSHAVRQVASCDRLRSSWKLQLRRDQLNILKYVLPLGEKGEKGAQEEDRSSSAKSFKVRRLQRKFEQILPFQRAYLSPDDRPRML